MRIDISSIIETFPNFRVGVVKATNLIVSESRSPDFARLIDEYEAECRRRWSGVALSQIPGIAVWRSAYRSFGIKRTSYRSSVERLVKNVLANRSFPAINNFVDAYNAVSLSHVMPAGADDLDRVVGDIAFRYSRPGDYFADMAGGSHHKDEEPGMLPSFEPPKQGEVVYVDEEKVLCRRWNWRQDARSLVHPETRHAVITLQFNGVGDLDAGLRDLVDLIGRFAGGTTDVAIADRDRPRVLIG